MLSLRRVPWWVPIFASTGFGLIGAFAATIFPKWVQGLLFGFGVVCLVWCALILIWRAIAAHRRERALPPTVYLRHTANISQFGDKMFSVQWRESTLSLTFRGEGGNMIEQAPILEDTIAFELFNAGDEPVRHVIVHWKLPAVNFGEMAQVLGSPLRSFENGTLKLSSGGHGSIHPICLDVANAPVPVVNKDCSVEVRAPRCFTDAYSICALARARTHHNEVIVPAVQENLDPLTHLESWGEPMNVFLVELSYVKNDKTCRHKFEVHGRVWGGGQPYVNKPTDEAPTLYVPTEGVTASVDHVTIIHHEP